MPLSIKNVCFSYCSEKQILNDVSLNIENGQLVTIVGPNGSGKTTLVKCMNKIHRPSNGCIVFDELDVMRARPRQIAKKIGYVPQSSNDTMSGSVIDYILLGRRQYLSWKIRSSDLAVIMDVMQKLDIVDLANVSFSELSGGQKQKVLVARALAQEPDIFLFDEPTSNLDIKNQLEIMDLAKNIVTELHKTVVMVVHDLNMAAHYSDRVALMSNGRIISYGPPRDILTAENIKQVYEVDVGITADNLINPFVCV
jgi:iron complex transport system ATP-binding protein